MLLFCGELLLHVLGADEGEAPLEVGQHVAEGLRPVVLGVELKLHREELQREGENIVKQLSLHMYRVNIQLVANLPLTSKPKFHFGLARPGQARPNGTLF